VLGAVDEESQFVGPGDVFACCPQVVSAPQAGPHQNDDIEAGKQSDALFHGVEKGRVVRDTVRKDGNPVRPSPSCFPAPSSMAAGRFIMAIAPRGFHAR